MLTFAWIWLLVLLPLPFLMAKKPQRQQSGHLPMPGIEGNNFVEEQQKHTKTSLFTWVMWLLLVLAVSRPQWLGEPIEIPASGRDLMVAVDLSGSMQIEDMKVDDKTVDRFTLIQHVLGDFIERRKGDRIGLILFADHAYLQAPMTQDRRSVAQFLRDAQIGLVGKQTAIGEAIALTVKRFEKVKKSNRVLVLLTDGSNNAGNIDPTTAAKIAAKRNITIYTVGVGAEVLERKTLFGTEKVNPSFDLDESELIKLAQMTHGKYFRARNSQELDNIYKEIDKLEPVSRDNLSYRPKMELFYWPLGLMLLLSFWLALKPFIFEQLLPRISPKRNSTKSMTSNDTLTKGEMK
ncbi:vWA domain-containing protein [Shewanella intestini]|uniref:VWA domain-containing protein n=1 Tax=Shewanella intestini TaxID=2017544 RepID=A0ABS5I240_9GAMM|nr:MULTISPECIES: VWA domain-containing protein [Shewanella]MBR9727465.1 VWA domain-containing protein [Shewanella intestini]MRG35485.1 VWA domain-containing protein [Shewanella sp. XMDDZSB0408]